MHCALLLGVLLLAVAPLALAEQCEGVFRDYVYSVDASRIEEVRLTSRVGVVVVQKPQGHTEAARGVGAVGRDDASVGRNQYYVESDEAGGTGAATDNITVLVRVKATDNETLDSIRVSLGSSFGVFTALTVCGLVLSPSCAVTLPHHSLLCLCPHFQCPDKGSDNDCYSKHMRGGSALVAPSWSTWGAFFATMVAAYHALPPHFAEAALFDKHSSCATTEVTLTLPENWRGKLKVVTESANVAFNNDFGFISLGVETWRGHVSAVWESPLEVDETLELKAHDQGSSMYLANMEITGLGEKDCSMVAEGNGEITFSFLDLPPKGIPTTIAIDVMETGYFDVPNLRDADGLFSVFRTAKAPFSLTGNSTYDTVSDTFVNGTMRSGNGKHIINARSAGGQIVIFCKKGE